MFRFCVLLLAVVAAAGGWAAPGAGEMALYLDELMVEGSTLSGSQEAAVTQSYNVYQRFDRSMNRLRRFGTSGGDEFDLALRNYLMRREAYLYTLREIRNAGSSRYKTLKLKLDSDLAALEKAYINARELFR